MAKHPTHSKVPQVAQQAHPGKPVVHNESSGVFSDLSAKKEHLQLHDYMFKIPGMTIAFDPYGPLSDDYLYLIELFLPKKQDVLQHLDANGPKPTREATAVVFHSGTNII